MFLSSQVVWDIAPRKKLSSHRRFGRAYYIHIRRQQIFLKLPAPLKSYPSTRRDATTRTVIDAAFRHPSLAMCSWSYWRCFNVCWTVWLLTGTVSVYTSECARTANKYGRATLSFAKYRIRMLSRFFPRRFFRIMSKKSISVKEVMIWELRSCGLLLSR
jgi:hypothetical protein